MAKYITRMQSLSLDVPMGKDKAPIRMQFTRTTFSPVMHQGYFITKDPDEEKAIEKLPQFGKFFTKVKQAKQDAPKKDDAPELEQVPEITTVSNAKQWLIDNKEVKASELPNKEKLLIVATELGVEFPDLGK